MLDIVQRGGRGSVVQLNFLLKWGMDMLLGGGRGVLRVLVQNDFYKKVCFWGLWTASYFKTNKLQPDLLKPPPIKLSIFLVDQNLVGNWFFSIKLFLSKCTNFGGDHFERPDFLSPYHPRGVFAKSFYVNIFWPTFFEQNSFLFEFFRQNFCLNQKCFLFGKKFYHKFFCETSKFGLIWVSLVWYCFIGFNFDFHN